MRCTQTAISDDPLSADTPYVDETRAALIVKDLRRVIREAKVDLGSGTSLSLSPSRRAHQRRHGQRRKRPCRPDWAQGVPEGTLGEPNPASPMCRSRRSNRSKHGGRLHRLQSIQNRARQPVLRVPPTAPESAIERTRSGTAERRVRRPSPSWPQRRHGGRGRPLSSQIFDRPARTDVGVRSRQGRGLT